MNGKWTEEYLVPASLTGLVLLMDIRHPLKFFDEQMLKWAKDGGLAVHILLTKADKLKFGAAKNALLMVQKQLRQLELPFSIQLFSALKKEGVEELALVMNDWLELSSYPLQHPLKIQTNLINRMASSQT